MELVSPIPRIVTMSECLNQMHKEEKSFVKEIKRKTSSKSSRKRMGMLLTLLMTAQTNTDFVNHSVPSTTKPSTCLVRVGTEACKSIISSILRYKDYDFHKNAWPW
ncbi:UNVERIFIED_CONTAM: hypothetical protein NCL1_50501 [Trichonephila clavipes]